MAERNQGGNPLFFGAGLSPRAPGSVGTLAAIPLYLAMASLGTPGYLIGTVLIVAVGVWASAQAAREFGVHDHGSIVIDEVAGFLVAMALLPFSIGALILGFAFFRLFDIAKPWPIGWLDRRVGGGWGIMLDDLVAGVLANCATRRVLALLAV